MKDHKENLLNNPTVKLLNPNNSSIGQVSKIKLAEINSKVKVTNGGDPGRHSYYIIGRILRFKH